MVVCDGTSLVNKDEYNSGTDRQPDWRTNGRHLTDALRFSFASVVLSLSLERFRNHLFVTTKTGYLIAPRDVPVCDIISLVRIARTL